MFASGSSDGILILWNSEHLRKVIILRPFQELIANEAMLKLNLTSTSCIRPLSDVRRIFATIFILLNSYSNKIVFILAVLSEIALFYYMQWCTFKCL